MYVCSAVRTLGEPDDVKDTTAWVEKLKAVQEEKDKAERRVSIYKYEIPYNMYTHTYTYSCL